MRTTGSTNGIIDRLCGLHSLPVPLSLLPEEEKKRTVMLSKFKRNKHQQHLAQLPKLPQSVDALHTLYCPTDFRTTLLDAIATATQRIYLVALYLENDDGGRDVLSALYAAKQQRPELEICVLVDWHRAQRGRIGAAASNTNADWYCSMAKQYPESPVPIYGVPVNTREALGVLHLKGFVIDDRVIYSGASLNDVYLHRHAKYRYDRYHLLTNVSLADAMIDFIRKSILSASAVQRLDREDRPKSIEIKNETRQFRQSLRDSSYHFKDSANNDELSVVPLVGLGKQNSLNRTIHHLMASADQKLTLCTPYFNMPALLARNIIGLLRRGKQVEIIVGDKTANDFYIPQDQPFKIIGALPYLYEINLRRFLSRLQRFVDSGQLIVRLWKDGDNSYHLKGMWVDDSWQLITGNNLNPRAWRLDLENAILIHDPHNEMQEQRHKELDEIRKHTHIVSHYMELESIPNYPVKVRKLIRRLRRIRIDRLISRIL
jgi:CDP-diacylglycerol--serine O-phosphatidyltransferase